MKHHSLARLFLLLSFLLAGLTPAFAQTAQVTGRISDATGAVVPGAQITLSNTGTGFKRDTVTNDEGYYTILLLQPAGGYQITVRRDGFKPIIQSGITLQIEQVARLDYKLETGAVTETVNITGEAPPLERESATIGTVVQSRQIRELPINGRNWASLMLLAPGAINTGAGNHLSIRFVGRAR